jgi:hypothetical protein
MASPCKALIKKALLIVAVSFLLYNFYQAAITTMFVLHFPTAIGQLSNYIESSQPTLQVGLFAFQEASASVGIYLRLAAGILAVYSAVLLNKGNNKYLPAAKKMLLLESLYFALLIPAAINQFVGYFISSGPFLDINAGISALLQALLIFPPLFLLSRRLKEPLCNPSNLWLAGFAASMYFLGLWAKHGLLWSIAFSSQTQQISIAETVGFVNSWVTLLLAAIIMTVSWLSLKHKKKLFGVALIFAGSYFLVYGLISIYVPLYFAFLPLTEFWMVSLLVLGAAVMLYSKNWRY